MALFNISVLAQLNLPESVRLAIVKMAVDQGRTATALEALLAKSNEPPPDESVLQAQIDDMARRLKEANDKLDAKVAETNNP